MADTAIQIKTMSEFQALRQRLRDGSYTEADMDQASVIVKAIGSGELTEDSFVDDAQPAEADAAPQTPDAPPAAPVAKSVTTPSGEEVLQHIRTDQAVARAIDAVPAMQAVAKSLGALADGLQQIEAARVADRQEIAQLRTEIAGMKGDITKSLAAAAQAAPAQGGADIAKAVGQDTDRALDELLRARGFDALAGKVAELDNAVNNRPFQGNPPRGAQTVRKGLGNGALRKSDAIALIHKSLDLNRVTRDDAMNAFAKLDIVDTARNQGQNVSYEDVLAQYDRKTLEEFAPA